MNFQVLASISHFSYKFISSALVNVLSTAKLFWSQNHSLSSPTSRCLYWEVTWSWCRRKTGPFCHETVSLLTDCTLHNAFSLLNFLNVPRVKKMNNQHLHNTTVSSWPPAVVGNSLWSTDVMNRRAENGLFITISRHTLKQPDFIILPVFIWWIKVLSKKQELPN